MISEPRKTIMLFSIYLKSIYATLLAFSVITNWAQLPITAKAKRQTSRSHAITESGIRLSEHKTRFIPKYKGRIVIPDDEIKYFTNYFSAM